MLAVFNNVEGYVHWYPQISESRRLLQISDFRSINYMKVGTPTSGEEESRRRVLQQEGFLTTVLHNCEMSSSLASCVCVCYYPIMRMVAVWFASALFG